MSEKPSLEPISTSSGSSTSNTAEVNFSDPTVLQVVDFVITSTTNAHSRRAYSAALFDFLRWHEKTGRPGFNLATISVYKDHLVADDLSSSTINLRLSAIRKLSQEFGERGILDPLTASKIARIRGLTPLNSKVASWLSREQAQSLINAPDNLTLKGLRDRAILALLIGCGLNRSEISNLTFANIQQFQGRWAIINLAGKGNRTRNVPMPPWTKVALDAWTNALKDLDILPIPTQRIFRAINKGDTLSGERQVTEKSKSDGFMSPQAIADVLKTYADELGYKNVTSQATRRTFAKLSHKGGAEIDQIQLSLGHTNRKTTKRFLDQKQNFNDAPADRLDINLET